MVKILSMISPGESVAATETSLGLVIGLLIAFLMILIGAVIVTICLASVVVRKRKATIRSLQLEGLNKVSNSVSGYCGGEQGAGPLVNLSCYNLVHQSIDLL